LLQNGKKRQCSTAWPASAPKALSPIGYVLSRPRWRPLRITGPLSALWRRDGFWFSLPAQPGVFYGAAQRRWEPLPRFSATVPHVGVKVIPVREISRQATRRDKAADRKRHVFCGYHYLDAGYERRWAARAPAETHGQRATRRPYQRDIPVARDHNTKPVPADKSRKPAAPVGCEYRWLEGWGWGLFDRRAPTTLTWRSDGGDIAAHVIECKCRREAAIDGLLSNFGCLPLKGDHHG